MDWYGEYRKSAERIDALQINVMRLLDALEPILHRVAERRCSELDIPERMVSEAITVVAEVKASRSPAKVSA